MRSGTGPGDRDLLTFYADAGIAFRGMIPGRPGDTFGASAGTAKIGRNARGLDRDTQVFSGNATYPVRGRETVLEVTYQAQVAPWMTLQPDIQYVIHPSGRVLNTNGSVRSNALVVGLRSVVNF